MPELKKVNARMCDRLYYTVGSVGKTRKITPEGFLLCQGVAIARTGTQIYNAHELELEPDKDGHILVERLPDEVFSQRTIASFEGKPITVEHPNDFVKPENWKELTVGIVQNVRRGEGLEDDLLLADLLITAPDAIRYANAELPELSAGYNSDYEQNEPGRAIQRNITGNHVAMVDRGRAGPRISIKDSIDEEIYMAKYSDGIWNKLNRRLRKVGVKAEDAAEICEDLQEESGSTETRDGVEGETGKKILESLQALTASVSTIDSRVKTIEAARTKDAEEEAAEAERMRKEKEAKDAAHPDSCDCEECEAKKMEASEKTGDTILEAESPGSVLNLGTVYTGDSAGSKPNPFNEITVRAEILAPGIQIPTTDSIKGTKGAKLATFMRTALEKCASTDSGKDVVETFLMGRKIGDLKGHALLGAFNGAAQLMRTINNRATQRVAAAKTSDFGKPVSPGDINKRNQEFWKKQSVQH